MNTLETMKELYSLVKSTDHWVNNPEFQEESMLASSADAIIRHAEVLKEARNKRIEKLAAEGPRIYESHGDLVVVLLRDGEEWFKAFPECLLRVARTDDAAFAEKLNVTGPKHVDGYIYMLMAEPMEFGRRTSAIWVSHDEAAKLKAQLKAMREADDW